MVSGMHEVVPDIRVEVELAVSRVWSKKAKLVRDKEGRVQVWEPAAEPVRSGDQHVPVVMTKAAVVEDSIAVA